MNELQSVILTNADSRDCQQLFAKAGQWFNKGIIEQRPVLYSDSYKVYTSESVTTLGIKKAKNLIAMCTFIVLSEDQTIYLTDFITDPEIDDVRVVSYLLRELDKQFSKLPVRYRLTAIEQSLNALEPLTKILSRYDYNTDFSNFLYQHVWNLQSMEEEIPALDNDLLIPLATMLADKSFEVSALNHSLPLLNAKILMSISRLDKDATVILSRIDKKPMAIIFSDDSSRHYIVNEKRVCKNNLIILDSRVLEMPEKIILTAMHFTLKQKKDLLVFNHSRLVKFSAVKAFVYQKRIMNSFHVCNKLNPVLSVHAGFNS